MRIKKESNDDIVFENCSNSRIHYCEQSELRLHLESNSFTRQALFIIEQKLVENANLKNHKYDLLTNFQTI